MRRNLELKDLGDLLERPVLAVLATHRKDRSILLSPVWFEWADDGFSVVTWAKDIKSRNIARDPQISILVNDEAPPYRGIEARGPATITDATDLKPLLRRLGRRYMGEEAGNAYADSYDEVAIELIRLVPEVIRAWDFSDDM